MLGRSTGLGLKVPKTCTRPRAPGHAGEYRTCGGDGSVHGAVPSGSLQRFGSVPWRFGSVPEPSCIPTYIYIYIAACVAQRYSGYRTCHGLSAWTGRTLGRRSAEGPHWLETSESHFSVPSLPHQWRSATGASSKGLLSRSSCEEFGQAASKSRSQMRLPRSRSTSEAVGQGC